MKNTAVSIPGKLFLLGEYAVLAGGPALLTTVDRKIHIHPRADGDGYRVLGPSFSNPLHLPELVAQVLRKEQDLKSSIDNLTADLREFYTSEGTKLGIGSSAASTVALVTSLTPELSQLRRFELSWMAHRELQGGRGSGADIAASTFGGTLGYTLLQKSSLFDDLIDFSIPKDALQTPAACIETGLSLPSNLQLHAVWTGAPAHSLSFIAGVKEALSTRRKAVQELFASIAQNSRSGITALHNDDAPTFIETIGQGDQLMEQLGTLCDLPIITDTHRELRAQAESAGLVAKPSGAGGGDFSLIAGSASIPLPPNIKDNYLTLTIAP